VSETVPRLIYMANQISEAFGRQGDERAVAATLDHILHFWSPRMRTLIAQHLEAGGEGMTDVARRAVERLPAQTDAAR